MLIKYIKIIIVILSITYFIPVYSKNISKNEFNSQYLSNYLSALVSFDNKNNDNALKFFKLSKPLKDKHNPYLKEYIFALIMNGKVDNATKELLYNLGKKNSNFFEAYLLLTLDSIKRGDFKKSNKYLKQLSKFRDSGTFEMIIYETLKDYVFVFKNKKLSGEQNSFGNLSLINKVFQNCYLNEEKTPNQFYGLINNNDLDYSRYLFFYVAYLAKLEKIDQIKKATNQIDVLNSSLLIGQTKKWVDHGNLNNFDKIFSCNKETDILGEFFFLIANLYSSQQDFDNSNFYLYISNYLNPDFRFNLSLIVENYYSMKNYDESKKILNNFTKNDDLYYWYKIKKKAAIIAQKYNEERSKNFINSEFKKIKNPSIKILYDMANITKGFKEYAESINYYNKILLMIDDTSVAYSDILYRRGGSYERLKDFKMADQDLLLSIEKNPEDAYALNYLAYSWLERDYKINEAIKMLEKAYVLKENDPFILDSVGWAYYLVNDFIKAEKFLKRAIMLMPDDPVVNDHYGDILWKLNYKIQAVYYWKNTLKLENTENEMKKNIGIKILKGL